MTFTLNDPPSTDTDLVRHRIGDVDSADEIYSDEVIGYQLGLTPSVLMTSKVLLEQILNKWQRDVDHSAIGVTTSTSQKFMQTQEAYKRVLAALGSTAKPKLSGISKARDRAIEADPDRKQNAFGRGMDDSIGLSSDGPNSGGRCW